MQWLSKLMPKQKMQDVGEGSIQVGSVGGNLTHSQKTMNQTIYNIFVMNAESASNEDVQKPESAVTQPPKLAPVAEARPKPEATSSQRALLRLMAKNAAIESLAEAFMRREFDTDRVKRLSTFECNRTIRYLEVCMQRNWEQKPSTA